MMRIEICRDCYNTTSNHSRTCPSRPPHEHTWSGWLPAGTVNGIHWPARRICSDLNCGYIEYDQDPRNDT